MWIISQSVNPNERTKWTTQNLFFSTTFSFEWKIFISILFYDAFSYFFFTSLLCIAFRVRQTIFFSALEQWIAIVLVSGLLSVPFSTLFSVLFERFYFFSFLVRFCLVFFYAFCFLQFLRRLTIFFLLYSSYALFYFIRFRVVPCSLQLVRLLAKTRFTTKNTHTIEHRMIYLLTEESTTSIVMDVLDGDKGFLFPFFVVFRSGCTHRWNPKLKREKKCWNATS